MSTKAHQRITTEAARLRGRTNTMTTITSKATLSTAKRTAGQARQNSSVTTTSNTDARSTITDTLARHLRQTPSMKLITEVDDTNIDEVLSLSDPSLIPASFLNEIKQDEIYATILEELQKKFAHHLAPNNSHEDKPLSPHLFALHGSNDGDENDDDDLSMTDDLVSSVSSESNDLPADDEYDTDIEQDFAPSETHDPTGRTQYYGSCEAAKLVPCSYFMAHIEDSEMILRYHQFNTQDIRTITKALCNNLHIERLHLDGNYLQEQASKHIAQLLRSNDFITDLSVAGNRLGGGKGTKEICQMLTLSQTLRKINLSGNMFNELDAVQLIEAFEQNKSLRELDLSHNCLGEECGKALGAFISGNYSLEVIDLSWNNFRGKSAIDLINGIKENTFLKRCNLEMNGLGPDGGPSLAECVKHNSTLQELNISGARLNTSNAFAIAQGLLGNTTLQVLRIGDNEMNTDGISALLFCIKTNDANALRELDLSHMVATKDIRQICEDIVQMKSGRFVYHIGKVIHEKLAPNCISECFPKSDIDLLKRLSHNAGYTAKEMEKKEDVASWLSFTG